MVTKKTVKIENLGAMLNGVLLHASDVNKKTTEDFIAEMPARFLRAAHNFYPSVLRVQTGTLSRSFRPVARKQGSSGIVGLRSDVVYARIQHEGGKTRPHVITGRRLSAKTGKPRMLFWSGARHPVRSVNHPGSRIKPKKFFETPMRESLPAMLRELLDKIGFGN